MKTGKYLLVSQPNFPVPAVRDGAIASIIQQTIESIDDNSLICVSIWEQGHNQIHYDPKRYFFYKETSLFWKVIRKIVSVWLKWSKMSPKVTFNELCLLSAVIVAQIIYHPKTIVVHISNPKWPYILSKSIFKKINLVGYVHNSELQESKKELLLSILSRYTALIFVSHYSRNIFTSRCFSRKINFIGKIFVVQNGIEPHHFFSNAELRYDIRQKMQIPPDKVVILFVGRLIHRKGLHILFDAIRMMPKEVKQNVVLLIVGSNDYQKSDITNYIESLLSDSLVNELRGNLHFVGYVPHDEINKYYSASDIFVFPSLEDEGLPLSVIEALMSSLPTIISNVGGTEGLVRHGVSGYIVCPPDNVAAMSNYLRDLIGNTELRMKMGKAACEDAVDKFTKEKMTNTFWQLITNL